MNNPHSYLVPGSRLPPRDQLIMGSHALKEVLLHAPKQILKVFYHETKGEGRQKEILLLCKEKNIPILSVPFEKLSKMTGSESHQSLVAHVKGRDFLDVKKFLKKVEEKERVLVLMTDQIFDPQNLGSLIRSAECLGADAIVWSKNRGTDLTPVVAKASSGASELLPLIRISNLATAVNEFQNNGFEVVTAILDEKAENALCFRFVPKTLLVVGSEGEGIQPLISKKANRSIYLPMQGKIDSLNVTVAAAILMNLYQKQFLLD